MPIAITAKPAQRRVVGRGGPGDGERGTQGRGGQVGELGGGLREVGGAAHVARGDGEQAAAVGDAQGDGVVGVGESRLELRDAGVQVLRLVGDEGLPVPGVPGEVVAECLGGAEDTEEPVPQRLGRDQGVEELPPGGVAVLRLDEPDESEEGEVGIGGRAEGVQEDRVDSYGREFGSLQQTLGRRGIGETVPQQP